jgi:hypothetical protein
MSNIEQTNEREFNTKFRLIGGLFLLVFGFYGGGHAFVSNGQPTIGLVLMLANSAAVIAIGTLLRTIIARDSLFSANVYLVTRLAEGLLLGTGAIIWTFKSQGFNGAELNTILYRLSMIILGLGSIGFCRWLIVTRCVHVILAWLGLVGYPLLALAMIAEFAGSKIIATIFLVPGAVFELIFGFLLLFMGLRDPSHAVQ